MKQSLIAKISILLILCCSANPQKLMSQHVEKEVYYERLYYSCKAWGHMKYYHSEIAKKTINWDDELLKIARAAKTDSESEFNNSLLQMLTAPGPTEIPTEDAPVIPDSLKIVKDRSWIHDSFFSDTMSSIMDNVYNQFRPRFNHYLGGYVGGRALLYADSLYCSSQGDFPLEEFRILALFRYWNIINYVYPYKNIMDQDWDITLKEIIPKVAMSSDALSYNLAMKQLTNHLNDTHAAYFASPRFWDYSGLSHPPFLARYLEGETVVTQLAPSFNDIKIGDVLKQVNGIDIHTLRDSFRQYANGSNDAAKERKITDFVLYGQSGPVEFTVNDGNEMKTINVNRSRSIVYTLFPQTGTAYYDTLINGHLDIGIVDMRFLDTRPSVYQMFVDFEDKDAIIFDLRGYPSMAARDIIHYLFEDTIHWGNFARPDPLNPGVLAWEKAEAYSMPALDDPRYMGKVMMLFNENTQSYAEQMCMILEQYPDAIKIGSTTAGADGNIAYVYLPGKISTIFTGLGVFYPDYSPTQRVGIIPDYEVNNTIKGLRAGKDDVLDFALNLFVQDVEEYYVNRALRIFPNPTIDYFDYQLIGFENSGDLTIQILDIWGKVVKQIKTYSTQGRVNVSDLSAGNYLVKVETNNKVFIEKVVIQ